jgi:hypothetical protein
MLVGNLFQHLNLSSECTSSGPFCCQHMPPVFIVKHMRVLKTHDNNKSNNVKLSTIFWSKSDVYTSYAVVRAICVYWPSFKQL